MQNTFTHVFRLNANFFEPGEIDLKQKVFPLHPNLQPERDKICYRSCRSRSHLLLVKINLKCQNVLLGATVFILFVT